MYKDKNSSTKCSSSPTPSFTISDPRIIISPTASTLSIAATTTVTTTTSVSSSPTIISNISLEATLKISPIISTAIPSTSGSSPVVDEFKIFADIAYLSERTRALEEKFSHPIDSLGPYVYHQDVMKTKPAEQKSIRKLLEKLNDNKFNKIENKINNFIAAHGDDLIACYNNASQQMEGRTFDSTDEETITARKDFLEDLLIKFYRGQELLKNTENNYENQEQLQGKSLKDNNYIMSCGSIEKLIGIEEKYSIKNLQQKQSIANTKTTSQIMISNNNNQNMAPDSSGNGCNSGHYFRKNSFSPVDLTTTKSIIKQSNKNRKYSIGTVLNENGRTIKDTDMNKKYDDDNLLNLSIGKKATIILSKSSSNVHFNIDEELIKKEKFNKSNINLNNEAKYLNSSFYDCNKKRSNSYTIESNVTTLSRDNSENNKIDKTNSDNNSSYNNNNNKDFNFIQLKKAIIQCQFNTEDLKAVVEDLKIKVNYLENMNWICLSKRPMGSPQRKTSLPKHSKVKKRFHEICDTTLPDDIKQALRLPTFDSYEWGDADIINLIQTMFIELGLVKKFSIPMYILREWLYEVYKHYNEVPFHNFRHCFCVAQMMFAISKQTNLCQRIGDLEVLILIVASICHDLDHPGYNNIYQINARTELALRYNDISPLENHHCSIAFRLLQHPECNIFKNFNRETFDTIREGIIRCILATDMARHNEILTQFKEVTPNFDYSNRTHINLLCMVLIKVADISNEARPIDVAEPWLDRLLQEFFAQSAAEKSEGLPVTPFMDPDKISKPGSQVRFIGFVITPLFEALGDLLPELTEMIIVPVRVALDYYKRLNDALQKSRKSLAENMCISIHKTANQVDVGSLSSPQMPRSQSGISVKSRRSIPSLKSASRISVDEPTCVSAELQDLPEGSESGDSETATEVDVAEKTSKFKVDTESSNRSKSHSTSRRSSREKRPSMISEMYSSGGRMRSSYGNIHGCTNRGNFCSNRAVSLDQYSNRRLSNDGLQQVISDSNVFYNRHNRSLDMDGQSNLNSTGSTTTPSDNRPSRNDPSSNHDVVIREDVINMNTSNNGLLFLNQVSPSEIKQQRLVEQQVKNTNRDCQQCSNGMKSWKARFKQITDMFSFSFDRSHSKRYGSARNSLYSIRNNTASEISKPDVCCTISNNLSPIVKQQQRHTDIIYAGRDRAYSLDVPCNRFRYSNSSSGGGDSRKSFKHEDNSNRNEYLNEDNNSTNTSSGEVLPIRINGGGAGNQALPVVLGNSVAEGDNSVGQSECDISTSGAGHGDVYKM